MQNLSRLILLIVTLFTTPADAYEVWLADQSDTGKESGGYLYIYDGAQLAANPSGCGGVQVGNAMYINSGGGRSGEFVGVARVSNMKEGKETADPHGIAVRK